MEQLKTQYENFMNVLAERGPAFGIIVGLLPALLIAYLGYSFYIDPGFTEIGEKQKQLVGLEAEVARGKAVEQSEPEFKNEFRKTIEMAYQSEPMIPKESEFSSVMLGVQSIADRYKVVLTGLNYVKEGQNSPNANMLLEREMPATVVGNYNDVMRFFLDLSRQTRILIVRDYTIESVFAKQKGARPVYVAVNFTLLAYHAPPQSAFPMNIPADMMPAPPLRAQTVNYTIAPATVAANQGDK